MSRKRYRTKRRACGLCKPHKRGWQRRWNDRAEARLREFEREVASL